ncbi:MAG: tRNA pseudouridine(13) synthase TruD [Phycisphaerales bacterium]|jgi:tRNA pseudouridine13 synthase|nr:tRNA pseudouridine(13) synthase TruD [Phycisphaerales bacterium]
MSGGGFDLGSHAVGRGYATADCPGTGGVLREREDDFRVTEIPLYEPGGRGEHLYLFVEKTGLSTLDAVSILARHFGVRTSAIGYAGLKDKRAITRQWMSVHVPGKGAGDFPSIRHPRLSVLLADMHENKLRRGHLAGNSFVITIRETSATNVTRAEKVLRRLERTGVPNRIAEQRFGLGGRNHLVARAIVREEFEDAARLLFMPTDGGRGADRLSAGREAFARGEYERAHELWPASLHAERRVLRALADGKNWRRAIGTMGDAEIGFLYSALQSSMFNAVLDARLAAGTIGTLVEGDVAMHRHGRTMFDVTREVLDAPDTASRLDQMEIGATGPMWGTGMRRAGGLVGEGEDAAFAAMGLTPDNLASFEARVRNAPAGTRRPLRIAIEHIGVEAGIDERGHYVRCSFDLPRGAFATTVMREVVKPEAIGDDDEDAGD